MRITCWFGFRLVNRLTQVRAEAVCSGGLRDPDKFYYSIAELCLSHVRADSILTSHTLEPIVDGIPYVLIATSKTPSEH